MTDTQRLEAKLKEWTAKLMELHAQGYEIEFAESGKHTHDLFLVIRARDAKTEESRENG